MRPQDTGTSPIESSAGAFKNVMAAIKNDIAFVIAMTTIGLIIAAVFLVTSGVTVPTILSWRIISLLFLANILIFGLILPTQSWPSHKRLSLLYLAITTKSAKLRSAILWWSFWCHPLDYNHYDFAMGRNLKELKELKSITVYESDGRWVWRVHGRFTTRGFSRRRLSAFIQAAHEFHAIPNRDAVSRAQ